MTSIPADPSMVLGQVISPWRILKLQAIAQVQQPVDDANDRFNAKSLVYYQMACLEQEMINLGMSEGDVMKIQRMKDQSKTQMVNAAVEMASIAVGAEDAITKLKTDLNQQTLITMKPESPVALRDSPIKSMNLSFDSLKFDVQYFRNQEVKQFEVSMAANVSTHVGRTMEASQQGKGSVSMSQSMSNSVAATMNTTMDFQELEGTMVITAYCTHKMADVFAPFVLDAVRAVAAWNFEMKSNPLSTDPVSMYTAATSTDPIIKGVNTLSILTGITRASSFVGMVHFLKSENTMSTQMSLSITSAVQSSIESELAVKGMSGSFGAQQQTSSSFGMTASSLMSTSNLSNTASLVCMGAIPDIKASSVETFVKTLNMTPEKSMKALGAIQGETNGSVNNNMKAMAAAGKTGAQFISMKNEYIDKTVSSIDAHDKSCNSVIDTKTMFTAFESYVNKCMEGNGVGVPTNFYVTEMTIADIAKTYIRKYYPNGAIGKDAIRGQLGQTPTEEADEEKK